jgi:hypothetical protein
MSISSDAAATTVGIANGAAAKALTLGSTNTTSASTLQSGSGGISVNSNGGALALVSGIGALSISADAAATTLTIGTGAAVKALTLGSTNTTSSVTIDCGTLGVSVGASANAHTSTFGSTNTTSTTVIQSGSGGITMTGNITASGDITINGAAKQLKVEGGAVTDFIGSSVLTAGTVTIANTNIKATDRIFLSRTAANASTTMGMLSYTISAGASFTVTSLILGTPGSTQTADVSSFVYFIVAQV